MKNTSKRGIVESGSSVCGGRAVQASEARGQALNSKSDLEGHGPYPEAPGAIC